jgi:serine beta-lactamase-like protein LACTB
MHERRVFSANHYETTTAALEIFSADALLAPPGTRYQYSSYGYNLAGAAVEGAAKADFASALRTLVTEPLAITGIVIDDEALVPGRARGYRRTREGRLLSSMSNDSCYKWPSGGMLATPEELVRFAFAHLGRETCAAGQPCAFLSEAARREMFTSQKLADGKETGVGLGWRIAKLPDGREVYHHGGLIEGGRAFLLLDPSRRIAVAMASNIEAKFALEEALSIADKFANVPPGRDDKRSDRSERREVAVTR